MKYDVHLFAVVRVKVSSVEAVNEQSAAKEAQRLAILNTLFDDVASNSGVSNTEFDDTVTHILVESAGNGDLDVPSTATCFELFGEDGLTEVPFDRVSTHIAVEVEDGSVQSVVTNRPCQVVVLDHGDAQEQDYNVDEEVQFHDSEVDPWLRCEHDFKAQYRKERTQ